MSIRVPLNVLAGSVIHTVGSVAPVAPPTGALWLDTVGSAPAPLISSVLSPLTLVGGAIDIQQASATLEGSLLPADFSKLQHIADYPAGGTPTTSFEHLNGYAVLVGKSAGYVSDNARFDGTTWNRIDTARGATVFVVQDSGIALLAVGAGANPITFTSIYNAGHLCTVSAVYVGNVPSGTTVTVSHGWGGRPSALTGWANYDGNGTYYQPFSAAPDALATTQITLCNNTQLSVRAGGGNSPYCYVAGVFPRAQQ